jgi:hypothetical protein
VCRREFNRTWEESLAQKQAEEEAHKAEMKEQAEKDLEAIKAERELLRDRNSTRNREHEQTLCEAIDADIEGSGNSWERVVKLVDMGAEVPESEVDLARMRGIFIKKKNEPAK